MAKSAGPRPLPIIWGFLALLIALGVPDSAHAGAFELGFGFFFTRNDYGDGNFSWDRRWGSSFGYHFNEHNEVELAFQDEYTRNLISGLEDTAFHDRVISLNWVQSLLGKDYAVQPYLKLGVGQLIRDASGSYATGIPVPEEVDSLTGVLGAGMRIYLTRTFALRAEATTYLVGGSLRTWKDNYGVQFGASIFF